MLRIAIALSLALQLPSHSLAAGNSRWVHGSWVNLRAAPSAKADVINRLVINTEITLQSTQGDWCEITTNNKPLRGFLDCKFMGDKPLTLTDLGADDYRINAPRAFWLAPSARRLMAAGTHFHNTLLTERQREREEFRYENNEPFDFSKPPGFVRYPVPEFDAMKDLMKKGVIAAQENRPGSVKWTEVIQQLSNSNTWYLQFQGFYLYDSQLSLARLTTPEPVGPSLFKRTTDLATSGATIENLSAQFGIIERLRILGGPKWVYSRHNNPGVAGYWDMGSFELTLDKPVFESAIGRQGLVAAARWDNATEKHDIDPDPDEGCSEGMNLGVRATAPVPGYPKVKDPLVWIFTPELLPYKKVSIKRSTKSFPRPDVSKAGWQKRSFELIVIHEIDLDTDGIPDLSVWEGMSLHSDSKVQAHLVLANIAGEWHLIESGSYSECS
jgi:hypothetical protein